MERPPRTMSREMRRVSATCCAALSLAYFMSNVTHSEACRVELGRDPLCSGGTAVLAKIVKSLFLWWLQVVFYRVLVACK